MARSGRCILELHLALNMRLLAHSLVRAAMTVAVFGVPSRAQSSRDSAGISIVENSLPAWRKDEQLRLAADPRVLFGNNADSALRFRQVHGVMLLKYGRIAVADGRSLQLRIFSHEGQLLSVSAGRGNGSGQILNMHWARLLGGDTIAIRSGLSTIALYSSTGQFVRATALPRPATSGPPRFILLALLDNGKGVAAPFPRPVAHGMGARWTDSFTLNLVAESSDGTREIGTLPYIELEQTSSGPAPVWLSPIGVIAASRDRIYAGFGDRYEIRVYSGEGRLQSIIRRSWTPVPISPEDWEQWVVEWSKLWVKSAGAERDRDVQKMREAPYAETLPAFSQFIVDGAGRLWVRQAHWQDAIGAGSLSDVPAVASDWSVFDAKGRWLGEVKIPAGFQVFEIGTNYVAGVLWSNATVQVAVYDLIAGDH